MMNVVVEWLLFHPASRPVIVACVAVGFLTGFVAGRVFLWVRGLLMNILRFVFGD
ncbi:hypothetical protein F5Y05DRAFT_407168 [Hypoxylon sp. FL0543]|nr:hypothetical protein F5Y05DRAFT_407168 [Hypoxylon sp. FL0543]